MGQTINEESYAHKVAAALTNAEEAMESGDTDKAQFYREQAHSWLELERMRVYPR